MSEIVSTRALMERINPIIDWYQSDKAEIRNPLDIITDIVADLQSGREREAVVASAINDARELCHQIERCGCSRELTDASIMASALMKKLQDAQKTLARG